jgi:streptogramin lyase
MNARRFPLFVLATATLILLGPAAESAEAGVRVSGRVTDPAGDPIEGAMVSFSHGDPAHHTTVFTGPDGSYRTLDLALEGPVRLRVRRIGWKDRESDAGELGAGPALRSLDLVLERETDPGSVAAQLPANRWYALLLERIEDPTQREELVRQCTYCHQQGNWSTRMLRPEEQWDKVLSLMARMGAGLSPELRAQIPALFSAAYDPETAVPRLTAGMHEADFAPPPAAEVRSAVIEEWVLGHPASMQHDLVVAPGGLVYSVDMMQDQLYRLDPSVPGGQRTSFDIPQGDLPLGGVFGFTNSPTAPNANAHVGPHSLQVGPDGAIWITLALGNQLARFDPQHETWSIFPLEEGFYPHTLRIDQRGRVWYTIAASNHVGMHDPTTGEHRWIRLPAPTWGQAISSRMLPFFLWLAKHIDLSDSVSAGEGISAPIPYGIDIAPNGDVWFSQLNANRIGRIDPESYDVEIVETPFTAPRRLRFDSQGKLWIPGFSSGLISRFDPETHEFESWPIPIEPLGSDTPYALNVHHPDDSVWICGTNSDTLIRFTPRDEQFTIYPLPTRVTYTREIDFDEQGRVWTSNSNMPTWQIEGAQPRVLRLDPDALAQPAEVAARGVGE